MTLDIIKEEKDLVEKIQRSISNSDVVNTTLKTDERVIARVTDGIYRQPSSALRELISNAYDADAARVVIKTDAPRFDRISIEDDGHGMSPEALAHMLMHIGGSAKRQEKGQGLGITSSENPLLTPNGRKLIGKIGIGIFSVAQLTYHFQIITKTKGDNFRTIATVALRQYSDEDLNQNKSDNEYESGKVNIWREKASDINSHGTTIVLTNVRPQARETLQSKEIWAAIEQSEQTQSPDEQLLEPPKYHVGSVDILGQNMRVSNGTTTSLPWDQSDNPRTAFCKLVQCVWNELEMSNPSPQLDKIFDYYLQMIWTLSLSIPIPYVDSNIFDMDLTNWAYGYLVANEPKGSAKPILQENKPVRKILDLKEGLIQNGFDVYIDDLQLFRPIKFKDLPTTGHSLKKPLILIGKCKEEFAKFPKELSGGTLSFEAYLYWTPKIAPTEHRGSLIRINGASGTLFDPSFMRYQVSEQTRLKQITCEIFIHEGFDSALNIDRESFNYAHPHAVYLTRWLHSALRQLATTQKRISGEIRHNVREEQKNQYKSDIQQIALGVWKTETKDDFSLPPTVNVQNESENNLLEQADIVLNRAPTYNLNSANNRKIAPKQIPIVDAKIKAITQVLAAFGLLEHLDNKQQARLFKAIYQILETSE